jgi:YHS domain-containing protein
MLPRLFSFEIKLMFIRIILYMLLAVILITVLRTVIGVLLKGLGSVLGGEDNPGSPRSAAERPPSPQLGGELHRDPVCGTFVAETTGHQRRLGNQTVYYCSEACKEKHSVAAK